MKIKFNNDEILLEIILDVMQKIDLDNALKGKDLSFKENTYVILEDFCYRFADKVEEAVVSFSNSIPSIE